MHTNRVEDLEEEKAHLQSELVALKLAQNPPSEVMNRILDERNDLKVEVIIQF